MTFEFAARDNLMKMEKGLNLYSQNKKFFTSTKFMVYLSVLLLLLFLILVHNQSISASSYKFTSWEFFSNRDKISIINDPKVTATLTTKLRDSVTFLPLKDLRFSETAMDGNTWFMSSFNDTYEDNEAEYLLFPSEASKNRILCMLGNDKSDGTKNSYALAFPEAPPNSAIFLKGLTYISNTYFDYGNLWHGLCAMIPFVGWSMKHGCSKPRRWVLSHWGEIRIKMGSWLDQLMKSNYENIEVEKFENGHIPYCFERAVVMRHDLGRMGAMRKLEAFDLLRCKARRACGLNKGIEVNEKGIPIIKLTLLMRRGSRSFKDPKMVADIFSKECKRVEGCILNVVQSEELNFCDQVRVMTNTDVVASPHGAQLTNMLFMDRGSNVMEFFPKGWLELAGIGQYAHHWMAEQSGMKHEGAWWDPVGNECPTPKDKLKCFDFHKNGQVGHNETYFAEWARKVLNQASLRKSKHTKMAGLGLSGCAC